MLLMLSALPRGFISFPIGRKKEGKARNNLRRHGCHFPLSEGGDASVPAVASRCSCPCLASPGLEGPRAGHAGAAAAPVSILPRQDPGPAPAGASRSCPMHLLTSPSVLPDVSRFEIRDPGQDTSRLPPDCTFSLHSRTSPPPPSQS